MANYSVDDDLKIYVTDLAQLPDTANLALLHAEAKAQIDKRLRAAWAVQCRQSGYPWTPTGTLPTWSPRTLAELVAPSCFYVLFLCYQRFGDEGNQARAAAALVRFEKELASVALSTDQNADTVDDQPGGSTFSRLVLS